MSRALKILPVPTYPNAKLNLLLLSLSRTRKHNYGRKDRGKGIQREKEEGLHNFHFKWSGKLFHSLLLFLSNFLTESKLEMPTLFLVTS